MPTVWREQGFRFFFYSNEGSEPPHIHVEHGDGLAKFWLDPVVLDSTKGLTGAQQRTAGRIVTENLERFKEAWNEYFA